mgnify:FL=1
MTAAFAALFLGCLVAILFDWRRGVSLCLAVGFLQDPVRKLIPGQPVQIVVAVAIAFSVCLLGVYVRGDRLGVRRLFRTFTRLRPPVAAFVLIVLIQCAHTLVRTGNSVLAGLGLLAYMSPALALLVGDRFCEHFEDLRGWLFMYLTGAAAVAVTVLLQFSGLEPLVFSSIGAEYVYGGPTGIVRMMSGLMRSSEIAAWHLGAGACLLIALTAAVRTFRMRLVSLAGAATMLVAVVLTGRRKMLGEILLFIVLYVFLVSQYRRGGSRLAQAAMAVLFLGTIVAQLFAASGSVSQLTPYLGRGATVVSDSTERLYSMTIEQFRWVVYQNGWLGSGAGTAAQGSQYFGGGEEIVGGGAEGGLAKVLAELGIPGALILVWLAFAIARSILRISRFARRAPPSQALLLYGLVAFLPANAVVFLTAHQVFGDPFVLIVLGLVTGSILAFPRMSVSWGAMPGASTTTQRSRRAPRRVA